MTTEERVVCGEMSVAAGVMEDQRRWRQVLERMPRRALLAAVFFGSNAV